MDPLMNIVLAIDKVHTAHRDQYKNPESLSKKLQLSRR